MGRRASRRARAGKARGRARAWMDAVSQPVVEVERDVYAPPRQCGSERGDIILRGGCGRRRQEGPRVARCRTRVRVQVHQVGLQRFSSWEGRPQGWARCQVRQRHCHPARRTPWARASCDHDLDFSAEDGLRRARAPTPISKFDKEPHPTTVVSVATDDGSSDDRASGIWRRRIPADPSSSGPEASEGVCTWSVQRKRERWA